MAAFTLRARAEYRDIRKHHAIRLPRYCGHSVFRMGEDGKLDFVRKYDIDVGRLPNGEPA
jgi:hypothetical protein